MANVGEETDLLADILKSQIKFQIALLLEELTVL
jgi:hypothetical protein